MPSYRCYFLDDEDHIKARTVIEADALSYAIDGAFELLSVLPEFRAVEIWQGTKRLYPQRQGVTNDATYF